MMLYVVYFIVCLTGTVMAKDLTVTSDRCWQRKPNCRLTCVRPIETIDLGERECVEKCRSVSRCQGVVYNRYERPDERCELYDQVPIGSGPDVIRPSPNFGRRGVRPPPGPRFGGKGNGFSFGRRRGRFYRNAEDMASGNSTDIVAVDPPHDDGSDPLAHYRGRSRHGNHGYKPPRRGPSGSKRPGNACSTGANGSTVYKWTGKCERRPLVTVTPPTTGTPSTFPTTSPVTSPIPVGFTCPPGQTVRYLIMNDFQVTDLPTGRFQAWGRQQCLTACDNNQVSFNQQALCRSATYNENTRQCSLYAETIDQMTGDNGIAAPGYTYHEKVCVTGAVTTGCTNIVETLPQKVLVGHATNVITRLTYAECVKACYEALQVTGERCVSAQYYFGFDDSNCILNNVGRRDHPDLMVDESEYRVNYFEIDCLNADIDRIDSQSKQGNLIVVGEPNWSPWSLCDKISNEKVRFRNCKNYNAPSCEAEKGRC